MIEILDPDIRIVDTHHHLWRRPGSVYDTDEYLADLRAGHRVVASVAVEAQTSDLAGAARDAAALAETAHARVVGERFSSGVGPQPCAAIVAFVDLASRNAAEALDAQLEAAGGRLRGIRQKAAWHPEPAIHAPRLNSHPALLEMPAFRHGFELLQKHALLFEAWVYHPQLGGVADLAKRFPGVGIVLEHAGTPLLAQARNEGERAEIFAEWSASLRVLARLPNVILKISGLGMECVTAEGGSGSGSVSVWPQIVDTCLAEFGCDRCMFGSNFPIDRRAIGFPDLWNAYKRLTAHCTADERGALFETNARRIYRI